jgi:hypothetical protein
MIPRVIAGLNACIALSSIARNSKPKTPKEVHMALCSAEYLPSRRRAPASRLSVAIFTPASLAAALLLCLFLSGCTQWNVGGEAVITSDAAQAIPYSGSSYSTSDGRYTWSSSGVGNDYHYIKYDSDGTVKESGLLRALHITGNVYAVQVKNMNDDQSAYVIGLFSITSSSINPVKIADDDAGAAEQIAGRFNVHGGSVFADGNVPVAAAEYLRGNAGDILGFLRALSGVNFVDDNS